MNASVGSVLSQRLAGNRNNSATDVRDRDVFIYGLADPVTGEIRYIGKSARPRARRAQLSGQGGACLMKWLRDLQRDGANARVAVLKRVPSGEDASEWERRYIEIFEALGARLFNWYGVSKRYPRAA